MSTSITDLLAGEVELWSTLADLQEPNSWKHLAATGVATALRVGSILAVAALGGPEKVDQALRSSAAGELFASTCDCAPDARAWIPGGRETTPTCGYCGAAYRPAEQEPN